MTQINSRWRTAARKVIEKVLTGLPARTTLKEVARIIRRAYPFGARYGWPYKSWLRERRLALKAFEEKGPPGASPASITFVLWKGATLRVDCGWCFNRVKGGCVSCLRHHARAAEARRDRRAAGVWIAAAQDKDPVALAALLDLLEEALGERPAHVVEKTHEQEIARAGDVE